MFQRDTSINVSSPIPPLKTCTRAYKICRLYLVDNVVRGLRLASGHESDAASVTFLQVLKISVLHGISAHAGPLSSLRGTERLGASERCRGREEGRPPHRVGFSEAMGGLHGSGRHELDILSC
eukprot:3415860-Rhodomonas_salina.1